MKAHIFAAIAFASVATFGESAVETATAEPQMRQQARQRENMRFRGMDTNNDGRITRAEWQGNDRAFRNHDWNGDGVLSGDEVRPGAARDRRMPQQDYEPRDSEVFYDWTAEGFRELDHDRNGRISRNEWHFDMEGFVRADRNRDNVLTRAEFLGNATSDDDREDRFDDLDTNNNNRIERGEWHGTRDAFEWLDRNNDGVLTRAETIGNDATPDPNTNDAFASLDIDGSGAIEQDEWHWSLRSFTMRDRNGDRRLSRAELGDAAMPTATTGRDTSSHTAIVSARTRWTDTGVEVQAGDRLEITADGRITLSGSAHSHDAANAAGSVNGRRAAQAPLPDMPAGAVIARIGNSAPFYVGDRHAVSRASNTGRLYLSVNDDYLEDNNGQFRVTISVNR